MLVSIEKSGKKYKAIVPDDAAPELWQYGIIVGPPDLLSLGLPPSIEVRLHNELYIRDLITKLDVQRKPWELQAALMAALKLDAQVLETLYEEG